MAIFARPADLANIDARALLETSFHNPAPFGVPTTVLRPSEFEPCVDRSTRPMRFSGSKGRELLKTHLREFFNTRDELPPDHRGELVDAFVQGAADDLIMLMAKMQFDPHQFSSGCICYPFKGVEGPFAWQKGREGYEESECALVFALPEHVTGGAYAEDALSLAPDSLPALPGRSEQWQFFLLWHEFAHSGGAAEPQADEIAALVTRQAFGDCSFIRTMADLRMATCVTKYFQPIQTTYYGLPLVDALDSVASLPQAVVDGLSMERIRDVRFEKPDFEARRVQSLGRALEEARPEVFERLRARRGPIGLADLCSLKDAAHEMLAKGTAGDAEDERIARRFELALKRLTTGGGAYDSHPAPGL